MIGALVVSFPRKPRLHIKAQHKENLFPNSTSLIERCHKIAVEARGTGFLDKQLTVYDAATSYLLGLTGAYSLKWRQSKLYFGECFTILRSLGLHKSSDSSISPGNSPRSSSAEGQDVQINYIMEEMGRRVFWVLFVGAKSMHQLGASFTDFFIPPATPRSQYPALPTEVDDICIFPDRIMPQPVGIIPKIVGFNANVRVFLSYDPLSTFDMTYGSDSCIDWEKQNQIVQRCLIACKTSLDGLPRELMLRPEKHNRDFNSGMYTDENGYHGMNSYPQLDCNDQEAQKRKTQYEIQKANIYVSQLGTRSHIVERSWT